eukprot:scaffold12665_cov37-Attheya_sp.AAC.2
MILSCDVSDSPDVGGATTAIGGTRPTPFDRLILSHRYPIYNSNQCKREKMRFEIAHSIVYRREPLSSASANAAMIQTTTNAIEMKKKKKTKQRPTSKTK